MGALLLGICLMLIVFVGMAIGLLLFSSKDFTFHPAVRVAGSIIVLAASVAALAAVWVRAFS